jgi:hypothetical protein
VGQAGAERRKDILDKLALDRNAQHAAEYRQTLAQLKKDYLNAYIAQHSKARLGVAEDKTKSALRKDSRLVAMRALAGISLMPTSQLTTFDDKLDKLKSCASLVESELAASPFCPHCSFRPANEQGDFLPAANVLKQLDEELDRLLDGWQQTLLDNLDDPIIQANLDLLKASARELIKKFVGVEEAGRPRDRRTLSAPCRKRSVRPGEDRRHRRLTSRRPCCKADHNCHAGRPAQARFDQPS